MKTRREFLFRPIVVTVLLICLAAASVSAHNLEFTDTLVLLKSDGTYQIDLVCDLDALALGVDPVMADNEALATALRELPEEERAAELTALRETIQRRIRLRFDGTAPDGTSFQGRAVTPEVSFPDAGTAIATEAKLPTLLGLTARLRGRVPEGATSFTLRASRAFPPVLMTILDQRYGERILLERGVPSDAYLLDRPPTKQEHDRLTVAGRYLVLGFWHIVPEGLDHILFVLGLFLLSAHWRPLLWQISAFTAAHTLTLALSTYGVVQLPSGIVEPLIALSIAYVAVENLFTSELKPWRPAVVFAFGLLHGLGFAGVLSELGLPERDLVTALLTFNVGVELGQLVVILIAFLLVGSFRDRPWYRQRVVIPASVVIAFVGLYWAVERAFF